MADYLKRKIRDNIMVLDLPTMPILEKRYKMHAKNKNWSKKVGNGRSGAGTKGIW
jgi:hypothetical protein